MAPLSKRVQDAGVAGGTKAGVTDHYSVCRLLHGAATKFEGSSARLVGLQEPARVAIIPAASYGLATAALNTVVERGQNVVTVHEQFPSNVHVWRRVCANTGAKVRTVQPPVTGATRTELWNEAILSAIDGDTAAVALGPIHWTDGTRFDLERIGERAREVGGGLRRRWHAICWSGALRYRADSAGCTGVRGLQVADCTLLNWDGVLWAAVRCWDTSRGNLDW